MRLDLAAMARRAGRKRDVTLPAIVPTQAMETDLFLILVQVPRLVATWAKERVMPAYGRALEQVRARDSVSQDSWSTEVRDDIPEVQGELDSLDEELQRLVLRLTPELRRWVVRTEGWHRKKFVGAVLTATQVSLETMLGPEDERETLEAAIARGIDLIKDISREAKAKTADAVWRGFQARSPARDVAKEIQAALESSRARALRIASHQTQVLSATLDRERQTSLGIDSFKWRHSGKVNFRPEHKERDGKVYKWANPPADGIPGSLPGCGCKSQAWIPLQD